MHTPDLKKQTANHMFCAFLGEVPQILNHWLEIAWVNDDLLRVYIKVYFYPN